MRKIRVMALVVILLGCSVLSTAARTRGRQAPESAQLSATDAELVRQAARLVRISRSGSEGLGAALHGLDELVAKNPNSEVAPLLLVALEQVQERYATHLLKVALFYKEVRGSTRAAEARLREIVEQYPKYSRLDEVYYQLGKLEYECGRREEAVRALERVNGYRPRVEDAKVLLERLKANK